MILCFFKMCLFTSCCVFYLPMKKFPSLVFNCDSYFIYFTSNIKCSSYNSALSYQAKCGYFALVSIFFADLFQNYFESNGVVINRWWKLGLLMVMLITWVEIREETQASTGRTSDFFFLIVQIESVREKRYWHCLATGP